MSITIIINKAYIIKVKYNYKLSSDYIKIIYGYLIKSLCYLFNIVVL